MTTSQKNSDNTGRETFTFQEMYDRYGKEWLEKLKTNLECRLNFNYKTVDNAWIEELAGTYYIPYSKTKNPEQIADIKEFVKIAKKNKVVVKADKIVIEPSSMYMIGGGFYLRCYLRFKIDATKVYDAAGVQEELIYSTWNNTYLEKLKKNCWYEGCYDLEIAGKAFGDSGYGFSVTDDVIADIITK